MEKDSTYIVNFNNEHDLLHIITRKYRKNKVSFINKRFNDPELFSPVKSYFNFIDEQMEFELEIEHEKFKKLKRIEKSVSFELQGSKPITTPIKSSETSILGSKMYKINIYADIKDIFLHLFEDDNKSFILGIFYETVNNEKYESYYYTTLPNIEQVYKSKCSNILKDYYPKTFGGDELKKLFKHNFNNYPKISEEEKKLKTDIFDYKKANASDRFINYDFVKMFQYMIALEDLNNHKEISKNSIDSANIYKFKKCPSQLQNIITKYLSISMTAAEIAIFVKNIIVIKAKNKIPVDIMDVDSINVFNQDLYTKCIRKDYKKLMKSCRTGKVTHIIGNLILFRPHASLNGDGLYHIDFTPNRICFRFIQRALEDINELKMNSFLKNFEMGSMEECKIDKFTNFQWFNETLSENEEQKIAVENIINCTSFPAPFIIFGGPGTGKSSTIVEAIAQIVMLKPNCHILVTAGSNSACDDIGNRLLDFVSVNKVLRLYSPSFENKPSEIDKELQKISNLRNRKGSSFQEMSTARVIILTLIAAGRIINLNFASVHFDYIFIDEAGSVNEPQTYIPLVGFGMSKEGIHSQVILAGDHKQLGPVVKNAFAKDLGLEVSLMERLIDTDEKYKFVDGKYDQKYVVQLKLNYRNHPAILHFSNVNFYNSYLVPMCLEENKNFALKSELLKHNPEFPIIFHSNYSPSVEVGSSLKNEGEIEILIYYITVILRNGISGKKVQEDDVGVISPYRGQRNLITKLTSKIFPNIEIGTVDSFQGREKKIMLFSCVRSGTKSVGFLDNEKRLNVALTRAQSLLIITGNIETLEKNSIWSKFIEYLKENNAIIDTDIFANRTTNKTKSQSEAN